MSRYPGGPVQRPVARGINRDGARAQLLWNWAWFGKNGQASLERAGGVRPPVFIRFRTASTCVTWRSGRFSIRRRSEITVVQTFDKQAVTRSGVGGDHEASTPVFNFFVWNTVDTRSNNALRPGRVRRTRRRPA